MSDYRPISLSNVVSRIVSKVLANRIKTILPNVIFDSQSAFVPNRLILDNNYVAYEILYRLRNRRQGKIGYMTVKLDIRKIMQKLGFIDGWVNLAMQCVTSAIYTILINGEPAVLSLPPLVLNKGTLCHHTSSCSMWRACLRCYIKLLRHSTFIHLCLAWMELVFLTYFSQTIACCFVIRLYLLNAPNFHASLRTTSKLLAKLLPSRKHTYSLASTLDCMWGRISNACLMPR